MDWLIRVWDREPILITTVVSAALAVLVAFGVPISDEFQNALLGLIVAVGALVARANVYSPATVGDRLVVDFEPDDDLLA